MERDLSTHPGGGSTGRRGRGRGRGRGACRGCHTRWWRPPRRSRRTVIWVRSCGRHSPSCTHRLFLRPLGGGGAACARRGREETRTIRGGEDNFCCQRQRGVREELRERQPSAAGDVTASPPSGFGARNPTECGTHTNRATEPD